MSSVSRKLATIHADAKVVTGSGMSRALCYEYHKGRLGPDTAFRCETSANPDGITCDACKKLLRERGQLYAIMLGAYRPTT